MMNKYKITYEAPPISEVAKTAYVTAYDMCEAVSLFILDNPAIEIIYSVELINE